MRFKILLPGAASIFIDYAVVVIEDCVDTMDGPALHDAALARIRTAFGTVVWSDEICSLLETYRGDGEGGQPSSTFRSGG